MMPEMEIPLEIEITALHNALGSKISQLVSKAHGKSLTSGTQKLKPPLACSIFMKD